MSTADITGKISLWMLYYFVLLPYVVCEYSSRKFAFLVKLQDLIIVKETAEREQMLVDEYLGVDGHVHLALLASRVS